jgi:hypothetical protein
VSQIANNNLEQPYSYQSSIGFQQQIGTDMSFEADYVTNLSRAELFQRNSNLTFNAAGVPNPTTNAALAVNPAWGTVNQYFSEGWSDYKALQTAFSKRFTGNWQLSGTYTLAALWDGTPSPAPGQDLTEDFGRQYSLAVTDQRHRAVINGIWQVGRGLQLSGLYFYGSGTRFARTCGGGDRPRLRNANCAAYGDVGSIIKRNDFVGDPLHRIDFRLTQHVSLGGRRGIDAIVEIFNLFNKEQFGSYTTAESNAAFGDPVQNTGLAYQPRQLQLGFRLTF